MTTTRACTDRAANLLTNNIKVFLEVKSAYDECDPEIQRVVDDMLAICADREATESQKQRAMHTVLEALFPSLAVDVLADMKCVRSLPESVEYEKELDLQEQTFSERLRDAIRAKGWTQEQLAERAGVGQPAISNMLNRRCRPQTRTVFHLAEALDVPPEELWPGISKTDSPGRQK